MCCWVFLVIGCAVLGVDCKMKRFFGVWVLCWLLPGCCVVGESCVRAEWGRREARRVCLVEAVERARAARVCVELPGDLGGGRVFPLSEAEFACVWEVLRRVQVVPPPRCRVGAVPPRGLSVLCWEGLELLDAEGVVVWRVRLLPRDWMRESRARGLAPDREWLVYEAPWFLADVDCEALLALPALRQAEAWAARLMGAGG